MSRKLAILISCLICHTQADGSPKQSNVVNKNLEGAHKPATEKQSHQLSWLTKQSRLALLRNRPNIALQKANQSLRLAMDNLQRAEAHILRALAYQHSGKPKPALHACQLAFSQIPEGKLDWYLLRSENQYTLKLHKERINGLNAGLKIHPHSILKPRYVDALIEAGENDAALKIIKDELPTLRWRAHWQLKKARILIALKRKTEAQATLKSALLEIQQRLNATHPNVLLLADRAFIEHLMGKHSKSKATLLKLYKHRAPSSLIKYLEARIPKK